MAENNPFQAPAPAAMVPVLVAPTLVRWGAGLALIAEVVLPLLREGAVAGGVVTVSGTLWVGMVTMAMQVVATSLVAWPLRWPVRLVVALIGVGVLVVVPSAYLGILAQRWVDPGTRLALAGIELSQGSAAALSLRSLGRTRWAVSTWLAVAATGLAYALLGVLRHQMPLGPILWLSGRLLRYGGLIRLIAG